MVQKPERQRRKTYQEEMTKQQRSIHYKSSQQSHTERSNAFWVAEEQVPLCYTMMRDASLHIYLSQICNNSVKEKGQKVLLMENKS